MTEMTHQTGSQKRKGHPKGLGVLFATEMWERFNYYGMRAVLILFMTKALLFDKAFASNLYGSYTGLVYLTPLIGGFISDRFWGNQRSRRPKIPENASPVGLLGASRTPWADPPAPRRPSRRGRCGPRSPAPAATW